MPVKMISKSYGVEELCDILEGELSGNTTATIDSPEHIDRARAGQITFIGHKKYISNWEQSGASAAIVGAGVHVEPGDNQVIIKVQDADIAMAKILELFDPGPPQLSGEIHKSATIESSAQIGKGVKIGAHTYVGHNVVLQDGVTLYPNVTIMDDTQIGPGTIIWSGTVVRERTEIGAQCILHNNVSIGADGFGYRPRPDGMGLMKIPQIGNVVIGNGVEIGANSCVDRGKFSSTIIGDGCKIDNLVQIAHNCVLGRSCIMAGASGLAGSVTLGDGVIIGGGTCVKDHLTIHSGAKVGACSGVMRDVPAGETVVGFPAQNSREMMKQWAALRRLT